MDDKCKYCGSEITKIFVQPLYVIYCLNCGQLYTETSETPTNPKARKK